MVLDDWPPYPGATKMLTRHALLIASSFPSYRRKLDWPVFLRPILSLKLVVSVLFSSALDANEQKWQCGSVVDAYNLELWVVKPYS